MRRVVVTGLGLLTPLGVGVELNWNRLISGTVGINKINNFDVSDLPCKIAGQIPSNIEDNEGGLNLDNWIILYIFFEINLIKNLGYDTNLIMFKDKNDNDIYSIRKIKSVTFRKIIICNN